MVMIDNEFMYKFTKRLAFFARELSGRSHVSMVLRCYLPANVSYWLGRVVVHESDSFVESYIVHPLLIGQAESKLRRKSCYVLAFFRNIPYT
jgi:membrane protein DedA with SNARE-associated domain